MGRSVKISEESYKVLSKIKDSTGKSITRIIDEMTKSYSSKSVGLVVGSSDTSIIDTIKKSLDSSKNIIITIGDINGLK